MSWETIALPVLLSLSTLLTTLIGWGTRKLMAFLDAKISNDLLSGALKRVTTLVEVVVRDLQQTVVDRLKADGKWTAETAKAVKTDAMAKLKEYLGTKGMDELKLALGVSSLEGLLSSFIESQVKEMRLDEIAAA